MKWNDGTSFPIEAGHGCLGCSEPNFWDAGSFYAPLSQGTTLDASKLAVAALAGAALGVGGGAVLRNQQKAHRTPKPKVEDAE